MSNNPNVNRPKIIVYVSIAASGCYIYDEHQAHSVNYSSPEIGIGKTETNTYMHVATRSISVVTGGGANGGNCPKLAPGSVLRLMQIR